MYNHELLYGFFDDQVELYLDVDVAIVYRFPRNALKIYSLTRRGQVLAPLSLSFAHHHVRLSLPGLKGR